MAHTTAIRMRGILTGEDQQKPGARIYAEEGGMSTQNKSLL